MRETNREVIIEAGGRGSRYLRDLWDYRELLYFLAWRDVMVRYKQTVIGVAWSLIRPFITMIVFSLIFGRLAGLPSGGAPYPILVFAAMLPWQFFSSALVACSDSVVSNARMVSKIYFPRLVIPIGAVTVSLVDFALAFVILAGLMIWYQFVPGLRIAMLPVFILMTFAAALGGGLWFAAMNVRYRDFRQAVPFLTQLGLFISPVGFSSEVIPEKWRLLYSLNPMVGVIDGFRWAILGGERQMYWPGFFISLLLVSGLLYYGLRYFRRAERGFADVI